MGNDEKKLDELKSYLKSSNIIYEDKGLEGYASDSSFLTRGIPALVVYPKTEEESLKLLEFVYQNNVKLVPRGAGSGTAGASLASEDEVIVDTGMIGVCDKWGCRLPFLRPPVVDPKGNKVDLETSSPDDELYVRVGAGATSDELNKWLNKLNWTIAVVPSSGYSTFGGNLGTNARGSGTPIFGPFGNIVNGLRMVVADEKGPKVAKITDRNEIKKLSGNHGLFGLVTELDVRIAPIRKREELLSAIVSCELDDVEKLGTTLGNFMWDVQSSCRYMIGEFLFVDSSLIKGDDTILKNNELKDLFHVKDGHRRILLLYQGLKDDMKEITSLAKQRPEIDLRAVSFENFKKVMAVRKAATGKGAGRIPLPGFEDIIVLDPRLFGKVIKRIFELTKGKLPGRPIGHHYRDGITIHYRPQAQVARDDLQKAWELTQMLRREIIKPELKTEMRREHGWGLELFTLASEEQKKEILELKKKYDPKNLFNPRILEEPKIEFVGGRLKGI